MNEKEKIKASRFLSFILRHKPDAINIVLDNNGWASVQELLANMQNTKYKITFGQLKDIVDTDDKKRYSFNDDFTKIRASQGHSVEIDLNLAPVIPPDVLYHGTAVNNVDVIKKQGLQKMSRQYVHLSKDEETAKTVGARHGYPIILIINAKDMYDDGYSFYLSDNGVWLTDNIPAKYIKIL